MVTTIVRDEKCEWLTPATYLTPSLFSQPQEKLIVGNQWMAIGGRDRFSHLRGWAAETWVGPRGCSWNHTHLSLGPWWRLICRDSYGTEFINKPVLHSSHWPIWPSKETTSCDQPSNSHMAMGTNHPRNVGLPSPPPGSSEMMRGWWCEKVRGPMRWPKLVATNANQW